MDRLHLEDRERVLSTYQQALSTGAPTCAYEYRFRRRDDTHAVISDKVCFVRDSAGKAIRALGARSDISERKSAEEERRKLEAHLLGAMPWDYPSPAPFNLVIDYIKQTTLDNL